MAKLIKINGILIVFLKLKFAIHIKKGEGVTYYITNLAHLSFNGRRKTFINLLVFRCLNFTFLPIKSIILRSKCIFYPSLLVRTK